MAVGQCSPGEALSRLEWMIQPGNLRTHHEYDENGNLERVTDPNGNLTVNTYDELNRLRVKTYTPAAGLEVPWRRGVRIEYVLDANGNPTTTHDDYVSGTDPPVRLTTTRVYDRLDRLTSETSQTAYGQSVTVGTTYFRNGVRRTITDAASAVTEYEYDGQNRLKIARSNAGTPDARATSYTYWPDGLVREVQSPNGVKAGHLYDRADRLRSLTNTRGGTVVSSYAYGYDRNGNREMQVEVNGGLTETTTYGYDTLNRLERITYPVDSTHPTGRTVTYDYDLVGNRTGEKEVDGASVVRSDKTAAFDPLNRLTSVDDAVDNANDASFTYDDNGNQRTKTTGGVTSTYVYDDRNQLAEVRTSTAGPTPVARFQYDAAGRRILKIGSPTDPSDSGTRQFVYDQTAVLQELDSTGLAQARYEWGGDRLLSLNRGVGPTLQRRFYSFDALGSVTNLTDDAGAARASYHLDTWGNYRFPAELTPAGDLSGAGRNRFGFTGHFFDTETQLYHAKARYFDPQFGRFTSQDSYLGELSDPPSLHRYFYGNANPTRYTDPTGHFTLDQLKAGWEGFRGEAFERAADIGDSVGAFGKGVGKAGVALVTGTVKMGAKAIELDYKLKFGSLNEKQAALAEASGMAGAAASHMKQSAQLLAHGVMNPGDVGDAALELGIEGTSEAIGGATFETALLVAPMAKGGQAAVLVEEGRHGINLLASRAPATVGAMEPAAAKAILATRGASGRRVADFMEAARERLGAAATEFPEMGIKAQARSGAETSSTFSVGRTHLSGADLGELMTRADMKVTNKVGAGGARPERHHIFVQEQRDWFKARGVDIDRYTLELTWGEHSAAHSGGWSSRMKQFIADEQFLGGGQYSRRAIMKFGAELRREFGFGSIKVKPFVD